MFYKINFLTHMYNLAQCIEKFGVEADFDFHSFEVHLRGWNRRVKLLPRFIYFKNGTLAYASHPTDDSSDFIGWLPYARKQWGLATDKMSFKDYCVASGLRTPKFFTRWADVTVDVVSKQRTSSFGQGIGGPFRLAEARQRAEALGNGGYLEEFIEGKIAKVWYWNGTLIGLEVLPLPTVVGDGEQTVEALVQARLRNQKIEAVLPIVETTVVYFGKSLSYVPRHGESVIVDFQYGSALRILPLYKNLNVLGSYEGKEAMAELMRAGPIFWQGIPDDVRENTLFVIDAMIDSQQQVWFLEMNSNPIVNPDTYMTMFEVLFGRAN
jgi:hypothetical protein